MELEHKMTEAERLQNEAMAIEQAAMERRKSNMVGYRTPHFIEAADGALLDAANMPNDKMPEAFKKQFQATVRALAVKVEALAAGGGDPNEIFHNQQTLLMKAAWKMYGVGWYYALRLNPSRMRQDVAARLLALGAKDALNKFTEFGGKGILAATGIIGFSALVATDALAASKISCEANDRINLDPKTCKPVYKVTRRLPNVVRA